MEEDDSEEEEISDLEKELWEMASELFDKEIWNKQTKEDMKEMSKKELSKAMFGFGFVMHQMIMDEQIKDMEEQMKNNPELAKEFLKGLNK